MNTDDSPLDRSVDPNAERKTMRLECIGSFKAHSKDGKVHTIEIWTHFGNVHNRDRRRVRSTLLVLTTTRGHGVDRIAQGQYRLTDHPEITLSSDDPKAP